MPSLTIEPIPFRSSNLAIPPSPFSPRSPLALALRQKKPRYAQRRDSGVSLPPPPINPMQWIWKCHQCRQSYPLGATRRCLEDGHRFCSGASISRSRRSGTRVHKRHKACSSEFDFVNWKTIGDWKRVSLAPASSSFEGKKDCWRNCDYPSECRWGGKLSHLQTTPAAPVVIIATPKIEIVHKKQESPATTFDHILQAINHLSAVDKRKSNAQKSPLQLNTVIEEGHDVDGDTAMTDVVPPLTRKAPEEVAKLSAMLCVSPPKPSLQMPTITITSAFDFSDSSSDSPDRVDYAIKEMKSRKRFGRPRYGLRI